MPSLCQNSDCFMHFQRSVIVLSNSHFLEMTMLISKTGTLIQIRIGVVASHSLLCAHEGSVYLPYDKVHIYFSSSSSFNINILGK